MWKDPIVEEIHAIRKKISQECNHDLKEIVKRLRQKEEAHQDRLVSPKKKEGQV